jgi:hypothetical protein
MSIVRRADRPTRKFQACCIIINWNNYIQFGNSNTHGVKMEELPGEVLNHIMAYLNFGDSENFARTSVFFRQSAQRNLFEKCLSEIQINSAQRNPGSNHLDQCIEQWFQENKEYVYQALQDACYKAYENRENRKMGFLFIQLKKHYGLIGHIHKGYLNRIQYHCTAHEGPINSRIYQDYLPFLKALLFFFEVDPEHHDLKLILHTFSDVLSNQNGQLYLSETPIENCIETLETLLNEDEKEEANEIANHLNTHGEKPNVEFEANSGYLFQYCSLL